MNIIIFTSNSAIPPQKRAQINSREISGQNNKEKNFIELLQKHSCRITTTIRNIVEILLNVKRLRISGLRYNAEATSKTDRICKLLEVRF